MKLSILILTLSFLSCISVPAFAQQEEYAFVDVSYRLSKTLIVVTKEGKTFKYNVARPEGDDTPRFQVAEYMTELNKEGYQLLSMNTAALGSSMTETFVFVRKK